ncbi:hypothetical protein JDV09_25485 [Mycobacterium sp. Y57]|uniref:hypothetical protein n=1 Tax=Mycolicibacterium xanthum TaxID=2796469 RepID=UPI001C843219|nr:hypothetical protein [Mycolicibacterium xanthum]MBX7435425.1 hypothetical protein [Mycolicibacterium xanthum]
MDTPKDRAEGRAAATPEDRATLLVAAASGAVAFAVGFNFGAFGEVFFNQAFTVWVIATVVFVGSVIADLPPHTWLRRLVLLVPWLWLLASWVSNTFDLEYVDRRVVTIVTLIVTALAIPYLGWVLVTVIYPDFANLSRRHKGAVLATIAVFLVVGVFFGANNDAVLTCDDFKVSGNDLPDNCLTTQQH